MLVHWLSSSLSCRWLEVMTAQSFFIKAAKKHSRLGPGNISLLERWP